MTRPNDLQGFERAAPRVSQFEHGFVGASCTVCHALLVDLLGVGGNELRVACRDVRHLEETAAELVDRRRLVLVLRAVVALLGGRIV